MVMMRVGPRVLFGLASRQPVAAPAVTLFGGADVYTPLLEVYQGIRPRVENPFQGLSQPQVQATLSASAFATTAHKMNYTHPSGLYAHIHAAAPTERHCDVMGPHLDITSSKAFKRQVKVPQAKIRLPYGTGHFVAAALA
jgi:hypothetical protein